MLLKVIFLISFSKNCHVLQETQRDYKRKGLLSYVFANGTKVKKLYNKPRSQLIAHIIKQFEKAFGKNSLL